MGSCPSLDGAGSYHPCLQINIPALQRNDLCVLRVWPMIDHTRANLLSSLYTPLAARHSHFTADHVIQEDALMCVQVH